MCPPISLPLRNARFLAATHIGYSPQARHKVNCPKGKRRCPGVRPRRTVFQPSAHCLTVGAASGRPRNAQSLQNSSLLTLALHNLSHLDTCILHQLLLSYKDVRSD